MSLNLLNLNYIHLTCNIGSCSPFCNYENNIVKIEKDIILKSVNKEEIEDYILQVEKITSILINKEYTVIESSDIPFLGLNTEIIKGKKLNEIMPSALYLFYNDIIIITLLEKNEYKTQIDINNTIYETIFLPIKCLNNIYGIYIIQIPYSKIKRIKSDDDINL